jgi:hypothetical protein
VTAGATPKIVYLAPRPAGVDAATFRDRWRAFGALAMSLPIWRHVWRYDQCDAVAMAGDGRWRTGHGGVGMIWFRSDADLAAMGEMPELEQMREAEVELFGRLNSDELLTRERVVFERTRPDVEVVAFLHRDQVRDRATFVAAHRSFAAALADDPTCCRSVENVVEGSPDGPDVVVELGIDPGAPIEDVDLDRLLGGAGAGALVDRSRTTLALVARTTIFAPSLASDCGHR